MDITELEVVVFDVGGFIFGTEVSQIISIVKPPVEPGAVSLVDVSAELGTAEGREEGATLIASHSATRDLIASHSATRERRVHASQKEAMVLLVQAPPLVSSDSPLVSSETNAGTTKGFAWRVDRLRGIMRIPLEQIDPLPEFLKSRMQTDCIWGIGKLEQELVILLDLDLFAQKLSEKRLATD